jgi:hypothetical protein
MKPGKRVKRKGPGPPKFDQGKEVRAIARERIGAVKPGQVLPDTKDKTRTRKLKHKPPAGTLPDVGP